MGDSDRNGIPSHIKKRVRNNPQSYIGRDVELSRKYEYENEIEYEPVKAIQKEIDGMARLLSAVIASEEVTSSSDQLLQIYRSEVEALRELEQQVVSELPKRERGD